MLASGAVVVGIAVVAGAGLPGSTKLSLPLVSTQADRYVWP